MGDRLLPRAGEPIARNPCDARLSPWADAATDAAGWQIITASHRLAVAVAVAATPSGGTLHSQEKGQWQARIPKRFSWSWP